MLHLLPFRQADEYLAADDKYFCDFGSYLSQGSAVQDRAVEKANATRLAPGLQRSLPSPCQEHSHMGTILGFSNVLIAVERIRGGSDRKLIFVPFPEELKLRAELTGHQESK